MISARALEALLTNEPNVELVFVCVCSDMLQLPTHSLSSRLALLGVVSGRRNRGLEHGLDVTLGRRLVALLSNSEFGVDCTLSSSVPASVVL